MLVARKISIYEVFLIKPEMLQLMVFSHWNERKDVVKWKLTQILSYKIG